jgi:phospholipase C
MTLFLVLFAFVVGTIARSQTAGGLSNIKNVVVLVQENLSFDHFFGGLTYDAQIDGVLKRPFCNPANVSQLRSEKICAQNTAQNIASEDPNHSIAGGNMQIFGTYHPLIESPTTSPPSTSPSSTRSQKTTYSSTDGSPPSRDPRIQTAPT